MIRVQFKNLIKQKRNLILTAVLFIALPVLVIAVYQTTPKPPKASNLPLGSVRINPEQIIADLKGKTVYLSALAYDTGGSPISSGISYQWGISTTDSIGLFVPNGTTNLASFTPSATVRGRGDIWVKAFGPSGQTATKSIPVYVGIAPTVIPFTPTPVANSKPVIWTAQIPAGIIGMSNYSSMIFAFDADTNDTLQMTITGLHKGLTYGNCNSYMTAGKKQKIIQCFITGSPTESGIKNVTVSVSDFKNAQITKVLPLNIINVLTVNSP